MLCDAISMTPKQDFLPGKEEDLSAGFPSAVDEALALHQLLHTLQVQSCNHTAVIEQECIVPLFAVSAYLPDQSLNSFGF